MKLKFQVMGTLVSSNGNCGFKRWRKGLCGTWMIQSEGNSYLSLCYHIRSHHCNADEQEDTDE